MLKYFLALLFVTSAAFAAAPEIRGVGAVASGVGAVSPGLPTGTVAGDLLIMYCETRGEEAINANASGWANIRNSNSGSLTLGTRLTVAQKVSVDGADATTTTDSGNHQICVIVGIKAGTFWNARAVWTFASSSAATPGTTVTIDGVTTVANDSLVLAAASQNIPDAASTTQFSAEANADLTSVTEQVDVCAVAGDGGCILVASGIDTTAGTVTTTTATAGTAPDIRAHITLVIMPAYLSRLGSQGVGP